MGYLSSFIISSSSEDNCRTIVLTDQTDYTAFGHLRSVCGIAIFWSKDSFATVDSADLSNSTDGWSFPTDTNNTYTIRGYIVPVWTAGSWANNSIVFYSNSFWFNNSGGATSTVPTNDPTDWTELTSSSHATFQTHLYSASVISYGYTEMLEELTCDKYILTKTDCYEYTLSFAASAVVKTISVTKYDGTALDPAFTSVSVTAGDTTASIDLTDYEDGVYLMTIAESGEADYDIVIYDICTITNCAESLLDSLFQTDVDPCCEDCTDETTETMWKQRHDLNQMIFYLGYVLAYINVESVEYLGVFNVDADRQTMINRVGDYVDKLLVIADRCGLCD